MFSWIRIRIQKGFYDQENAVEKRAKYGGGGRQEVSLAGSGFEKNIRIRKAKKMYRNSRSSGSGILKKFENVVKNS
jgi:hypothetical protein